jgi:hypothetical protein
MRIRRALMVAFVLLGPAAQLAAQGGGPPPEVRSAVQAIEGMLVRSDDASMEAFAAERVAPALRARLGAAELLVQLRVLRQAVGGQIGDARLQQAQPGFTLVLSGAREVTIAVELDPDGLITRLDLVSVASETPPAGSADWDGLTWETLAARLEQAEAESG